MKGVSSMKKIVLQVVIVGIAIAAKVVPVIAWGGGGGP